MKVWPASTDVPTTSPLMVVANMTDAPKALAASEAIRPSLPQEASMMCFGQVLFLRFPVDTEELRKQWVEKLQQHSQDVFLAGKRAPVRLSMTCVAPTTEAETIQSECDSYFNFGEEWKLAPPWMSNDPRPADVRARHEFARASWGETSKAQGGVYDFPELNQMEEKITAARRIGDKAAMKEAQKQIDQMIQQRQEQALNALVAEVPAKVDPKVVEYRLAMLEQSYEDNQTTATRKPMIGVPEPLIPILGCRQDSQIQWPATMEKECTGWGSVDRAGMVMSFSMTFQDPVYGLPALVNWLKNKKCTDLRYSIESVGSMIDYDESDEEYED